MGGIIRQITRVPKKIIKAVDKTIVEPLERPVKKAVNIVEQVGAEIVEPLERPTKKLVREVKETVTGTTKEDYRIPEQPLVTAEITPEVVPDETIMERGRGTRRTKRAGQAGTIIEGYGALQRPKGERAVV